MGVRLPESRDTLGSSSIVGRAFSCTSAPAAERATTTGTITPIGLLAPPFSPRLAAHLYLDRYPGDAYDSRDGAGHTP